MFTLAANIFLTPLYKYCYIFSFALQELITCNPTEQHITGLIGGCIVHKIKCVFFFFWMPFFLCIACVLLLQIVSMRQSNINDKKWTHQRLRRVADCCFFLFLF